jgi:hypothetical protein
MNKINDIKDTYWQTIKQIPPISHFLLSYSLITKLFAIILFNGHPL